MCGVVVGCRGGGRGGVRERGRFVWAARLAPSAAAERRTLPDPFLCQQHPTRPLRQQQCPSCIACSCLQQAVQVHRHVHVGCLVVRVAIPLERAAGGGGAGSRVARWLSLCAAYSTARTCARPWYLWVGVLATAARPRPLASTQPVPAPKGLLSLHKYRTLSWRPSLVFAVHPFCAPAG